MAAYALPLNWCYICELIVFLILPSSVRAEHRLSLVMREALLTWRRIPPKGFPAIASIVSISPFAQADFASRRKANSLVMDAMTGHIYLCSHSGDFLSPLPI